jgi:hypothetical protein
MTTPPPLLAPDRVNVVFFERWIKTKAKVGLIRGELDGHLRLGPSSWFMFLEPILGLQDAARKRRSATTTPGPWAGVAVGTMPDGVYVSVSLERWIKTKAKV